MFKFYTFLCLIITFLTSTQKKCDFNQTNQTRFNDDFTFIKADEHNKIAGFYLGNDLIYLNISKNSIIYPNNGNIVFNINNAEPLNFPKNSTKIYYCGDKQFYIINSDDKRIATSFLFNHTNNSDYLVIDSITYNTIEYNFYFANVENIFIDNPVWGYFLILIGCLITLYGSYHVIKSLVMHFGFLIYIFIGDLISYFGEFEKYSLFLFFGSYLISGTLSFLLRKRNPITKKEITNIIDQTLEEKKENKNIKIYLLNAFYGASTGLTLYKTIFEYCIYFGIPLDFINRDRDKFVFYLVGLMLFISTGVFLNLFDVFKKYRYLPCSAISGSFYIMKGVQYIIGGYFSSIIFLKLGHKIEFDRIKEITFTFFFVHISIIVCSIIFQINYIKRKEISIPDEISTNSSNRISNAHASSRPSNASKNLSHENQKEEGESLMIEESLINEENEINDQED